MRLIAVQTGLSPHSVLGGTITDREVLTRLADRGVEVHVLAEAGEPIIEHENLVPHYWRRRLRKRVPYMGNIDVALDLGPLLQQVGPVDWIRFNSPYGVGIGTVLAAGKRRVWGSYLHCEDDALWKWIDRWLPGRCNIVTCLSEDTRADLVMRCPAADRPSTVVVPMGIDAARFARSASMREETRRALDVQDSDVLVLYVGTLIPRKGIDDLVKAWELLGARCDARLLVIGRSTSPAEAAAIAGLVGRDRRVTHVESIPYEQMPRYFHASDIFLFPTHLEGFGIVVGEAMACGLPVVTTRAKGVRGVVVENETALLTDVGNPKELAQQLARLIENPGLRRRLGMTGRKRVAERFDWDTIVDTLLGVLESGLGDKDASGDRPRRSCVSR